MMIISPLRLLSVLSPFVGSALALSTYSDATMTQWLNAGGQQLAAQAGPMWFFSQALGHPQCYPTWALGGSAGTTQIGAAGLCAWPNTECGCRTAGVGINNWGPDFPVYYSYQKCNANEVRVAYNLFYTKDGFSGSGHAYDWERVIIRWYKFSDNQWRPDEILLSAHSGYKRIWWRDIQNTFPHEDYKVARGGADGRKNLDHPKIYVAWSKHAHFDTRNTAWNDVGSQLNDLAFRSQDWYYFPTTLIRADPSTGTGQWLDYYGWGDASSDPVAVHKGLCSA